MITKIGLFLEWMLQNEVGQLIVLTQTRKERTKRRELYFGREHRFRVKH